ncbi:MAG: electron transfer flavoprotein subunit alpha/FixB family protein [Anaerolineales bacterium]|nr:electron transfer flavoprotein subunit alpha/FixB family protein [Anaerolineales bacterium]
MDTQREIWVFADKIAGLLELIAAGRSLGGKVVALTLGEPETVAPLFQHGADEVLCLGEPALVEDVTETILEQIQARNPVLLLVYADRRGKLIAGRIAAALGATVMTDVRETQAEERGFKVVHMLYGGGAVRSERSITPCAIATVATGTFQALPADASRHGEAMRLSPTEVRNPMKLIERRKKAVSMVNLSAARRVVGVGRGLAKLEDLALIEKLAQTLEAEIACTRPISEGLNWLPRERYLGVSGAVIKPDLYLAIGISGQIQHMYGVADAHCIVAVNKDKNAPIFQMADYGIVGDLYKVIPLLINAFQRIK